MNDLVVSVQGRHDLTIATVSIRVIEKKMCSCGSTKQSLYRISISHPLGKFSDLKWSASADIDSDMLRIMAESVLARLGRLEKNTSTAPAKVEPN